ncbi:hypothetical protein LOTGIDRAFT_166943 [Lottia gigantea]|uniref:Uncharacterized protein n=1 Tax=Lottia gigantea TaxID=225164 RepID=V4A089_LOTGI|nr:hypothetical protein LOTGIDRAFT_166943 [Lottia gigantea]ESO86671.1 hypothetical protein LOTGIDRAFT_166943 [Lottia gigantea]
MAELSLVSVVLFIASGTLLFFLLFLLAKRQIARFSYRSARRPHIFVGYDLPKTMKLEIQRRFERVNYIQYEPVLLTEKMNDVSSIVPNHYHYRMKAMDAFTNAIECLMKQDDSIKFRNPYETMQHYLCSLCPTSINDSHDSTIIYQFSQSYDHARHNHVEFQKEEYVNYMELLESILIMIKADQVNRINNSKWKTGVTSDTEVVYRAGKHGSVETTHILASSQSPSREPPKPNPRLRSKSDINIPENKSSGYSSTDRSSSSRSSAEKLLPLSHISDKDESV